MTAMATIRKRADELRPLPAMTPLRLFWILRREFKDAERYQLVNASRLPGYYRGISPEGGRLRPVVVRWQKKGRPTPPVVVTERKVLAMDYPLMKVAARDLWDKDVIDGAGSIDEVFDYKTLVYVKFKDGTDTFYGPFEPITVRIEDHGLDS